VTETPDVRPRGAASPPGVVHRRSSLPVDDTVEALRRAIDELGAKVFDVIDHSGEAARAGLRLRATKLVVFGSPRGGTPAMVAAPTVALDLPLKVLVWADDGGAVWMTFLEGSWLAARHDVDAELATPLSAVDRVTAAVPAGG
jgi:uncharacterized protein (DUF302 family)